MRILAHITWITPKLDCESEKELEDYISKENKKIICLVLRKRELRINIHESVTVEDFYKWLKKLIETFFIPKNYLLSGGVKYYDEVKNIYGDAVITYNTIMFTDDLI